MNCTEKLKAEVAILNDIGYKAFDLLEQASNFSPNKSPRFAIDIIRERLEAGVCAGNVACLIQGTYKKVESRFLDF